MKVGIIGGGAAGMAAAVTAAKCGADVVILEKNERVGKKLLATGNGKCNLSNLALSPDCYHSEDPACLKAVLSQMGVQDILDFFHGLGLMTKEKNGWLYPACEQASAVLDVLRFALERLGVGILTEQRAVRIERRDGRFLVHSQNGNGHSRHEFDKIILACGSKAGLSRESEENGITLAKQLGLKTEPFLPALVQLICRERFFKALAGVRVNAAVTLETKGGTIRETGELQLTDRGISGIPVFQLSRYASKALARGGELRAWLDFFPSLKEEEWEAQLLSRMRTLGTESAERFFTGTLHKKIIGVALKEGGISPSENIARLGREKALAVGRLCKRFPVTVTGTNPFSQAQVCAGGVRLDQLSARLEAGGQKGLYLAGELLDADGRCGGYNLHWAWTTGIIAGRAACEGEETDK